MMRFLTVVLLAIVAGLVAVEVTSEKGIRGLDQTARHAFGLPEGRAIAANFKSVGIEGADVSANVSQVAAEAKAKFAEVAEKAIEAAQPDRSKSVTPPPEDQTAHIAEPQPEATPPPPAAAEPEPETNPEPATAADAETGEQSAAAAVEPPAAPPAEPAAQPVAEPPVAEAPADPAPAPAEQPTVAAAEPAAEPDAPAPPAAVVQPEPEAAPAPTGGVGATSYYGFAAKPDADQPWAAAAAPNPDYVPDTETAEAPAPAEPVVAEPAADPVAEPAAVPEAAPQTTAAEAPAPASTGGTGHTSYYGFAKMPDADQPWAAAASMNADYTPSEASAPVAEAPPAQPATPEPAIEEPQPAAPADTVAVPAEEPAPAPAAENGASSNDGAAEKHDAPQPPEPAAEVKQDDKTAVAPQPEVTPATQEAVEACRDALNTESLLGGLRFPIQRWDVRPENYRTLDKIARLAKDCSGVIIEVRGHTDNTGRPKSNQTLSDLRAKAVIKYLTQAGVPPSKLRPVGFGEDKPVGNNATPKGRAKNRRIEFVVTGG